jgi:ATP-dependent DNA helicase RecQ
VLAASSLVIFDLETTDQDPIKAQILEIAALRGSEQFHCFVDVEGSLANDLYAFQHIDRTAYEAGKVSRLEALLQFLEFAGDAPLCGHNIYHYDLPVLKNALNAESMHLPIGARTAVDTLRWAHLLYPTPPSGLIGYNLKNLHEFAAGKAFDGAHQALEDCKATLEVIQHLIATPPEPVILRLWKRLGLPETRFFEARRLEESELSVMLNVSALVESVNHVGSAFPSVETLFPAWLEVAIDSGQRDVAQTNQAFSQLKRNETPTGFTPAELESLRQILPLMSGYRRPQRKMALTVKGALERSSPSAQVMIQAPTGTGKTKGYLYPALDHQKHNPNDQIIIATHTKVLQKQVFDELNGIAEQGFTARAALVKSVRDDLCLDALEEAIRDFVEVDDTTFVEGGAALAVLAALARDTQYDLESLPAFWQSKPAFREVRLATQTHKSRCPNCTFAEHCAYQIGERQREQSSIWITNQAWLLASFAARDQNSSNGKDEAPRVHFIVDEAHNLEDVATQAFSRASSAEDARFHLRQLYDPPTRKGLLASRSLDDTQIRVFSEKAKAIFGAETSVRHLAAWLRDDLLPACVDALGAYEGRVTEAIKQLGKGDPKFSLNLLLTPSLARNPEWSRLVVSERRWRQTVSDLLIVLREFSPSSKLGRRLERIIEFFEAHIDLLEQRRVALEGHQSGEGDWDDNWLHLTTLESSGRWTHVAQPIDLEPLLTPFWAKVASVTLTSATLLPGADGEFRHFKDALALPNAAHFRLEESLPYERAHILIPRHLPEARATNQGRFERLYHEELLSVLPRVNRSLSLFTARSRLESAKAVLERHDGIATVLHAPLTRRERESVSGEMQDQTKRAVALGTRAFMEGVDFPDLNVVNLERIPFPAPDFLLTARQKRIEKRATEEGRDGFEAAWNYYLGKALLTFTQAFGRLVRDDRVRAGDGAFILWDKRILSAHYYGDLLETLPLRLLEEKDAEGRATHLVYPKRRREFYDHLERILGISFADIGDDLQDEATTKLLEIRRLLADAQINQEEAITRVLQLFWNPSWNFDTLHDAQKQAINAALEKRDAIVLLPTGFGKSLTFQLPALLSGGLTVVISPLIALMEDQVRGLRERGAPVAAINAQHPGAEQRGILAEVESGNINLLYLSPERINRSDDLEQTLRRLASQGKIKRLIFDEAHCFSQWGHDFRPDYLRVTQRFNEIGVRLPIACLTATATQAVKGDIERRLELRPNKVLVTEPSDRPTLEYHAINVRGDEAKLRNLLQIIEYVLGKRYNSDADKSSIIVYAATRRATESIANAITKLSGHRAEAYHGGMSAVNRAEVQHNFDEDLTRIIVATNAFGMGVDKPNVRAVIHFHPPSNLPAYIQEAGRAGRDQRPALAVLLHANSDWKLLEFMGQVGLPQSHHAEILLQILREMGGRLCVYNLEIATRINSQLKNGAEAIEPDEVVWLLNTMQQSNLLEYDYTLGKARLVVHRHSLLEPIGTDNLELLSKIGVNLTSKALFHKLDFSQLERADADALAGALYEQVRRTDSPELLFNAFEPALELRATGLGSISTFESVLSKRFEQRKRDVAQMRAFANGSVCRRQALLEVFSEIPRPERDRNRCCDNCNHRDIPWGVVAPLDEDVIAHVYRPNQAVLEFLAQHKREFERYDERVRKLNADFQRVYSGLGKAKIVMALQGIPVQARAENPIQLKWWEQQLPRFGSLIGITDRAIGRSLSELERKGLTTVTPYEFGKTHCISALGLKHLERQRKGGNA